MEVALTRNRQLATELLTHPSIWPSLTNDDAPPLGEFEAPDAFTYLVATDGGEVAGLFGVRMEQNAAILHVAMLPAYRGAGTRKAGEAAMAWVWANTGAERVLVRLEAWNTKARAAAVRAGFKPTKTLPGAVRRGGRLVDILELEKRRGIRC